MSSPGSAFRSLLRSRRSGATTGSLVLPGCFDGIVARMAVNKGFEGLYLSGGGTSALTGVPDVGIMTCADFEYKIRNISNAVVPGVPLLADADTGFSDPEATVHAYIRAGAAGLHIEDQVFPKRCGHLQGKELVPAEDFAVTVKRCVDAVVGSSRDSEFVVCARTDARGVKNGSVADTVERLQMYADAGAHMLFPEGLRTAEEFAFVADAIKSSHGGAAGDEHPFLLANMTEFGVSPYLTAQQYGELGYDVTIYPMSLFRIAMRAVDGALDTLRDKGTFESEANEEGMMVRKELYELLQYDPSSKTPWSFPSATTVGGQGDRTKK